VKDRLSRWLGFRYFCFVGEGPSMNNNIRCSEANLTATPSGLGNTAANSAKSVTVGGGASALVTVADSTTVLTGVNQDSIDITNFKLLDKFRNSGQLSFSALAWISVPHVYNTGDQSARKHQKFVKRTRRYRSTMCCSCQPFRFGITVVTTEWLARGSGRNFLYFCCDSVRLCSLGRDRRDQGR
jgi:hypothetical protein